MPKGSSGGKRAGGGVTTSNLAIPSEYARKDTWNTDDIIKATRQIVDRMKPELPTLEGSEKQVSWAEEIRAKSLREITEIYADMRSASDTYFSNSFKKLPEPAVRKQAMDMIDQAMLNFRRNTSAKWWIDNRSKINNFTIHINAQK